MTPQVWRKCGLVAAIGAFAMPIIVAFVQRTVIRSAFDSHLSAAMVATALVVASMAVQALATVALVRNTPNSIQLGRKVAAVHGAVALTVLTLSAASGPIAKSMVFPSWYCAWFGPNPQFGGEPSKWLGLTFLPAFVLAQWAFLRLAEPGATARDVWRGIAIACIASSALLGVWTFCPQLNNGPWNLFSDAPAVFFNIGVIVHLVANWQIAVRARLDWAWAGLIGFGCLVSGLCLIHMGDFIKSSGDGQNLPLRDMSVSFILHVGWYELSPGLPVVAYALTAIGSVVLFRTRRERTQPRRLSERDEPGVTPKVPTLSLMNR